jgi:hypothetical protein
MEKPSGLATLSVKTKNNILIIKGETWIEKTFNIQ